jgi:hypothetical protein
VHDKGCALGDVIILTNHNKQMIFPAVLQSENTSTILFWECKLLPEVAPKVSEFFWSWVGSLQKKPSKSLNFGMHPGANNSIKKQQ